MVSINRIRFGAQVGQHVMSTPHSAFMSQCRDVYWPDDDSFARARRRFGQEAPVEVDYLAAARP